jgi:hypothetical protein
MKNYELHYAALPLGTDIITTTFQTWGELSLYAIDKLIENDNNKVYLYTNNYMVNPIIISHNRVKIIDCFAKKKSDEYKHYVQEYESYEDAYGVALDMMEEHELCYGK